MSPLERITDRITRVGDLNDPKCPFPLLALSEFFEGNDVLGSICCNLHPTPRPQELHELFRDFEAKPEVDRVLIQVSAFDDPDWPFCDTAWVITTASEGNVGSWFPDHLRPNEVWMGYIGDEEYENVDIPETHFPVACWWD